MTELYQQLKQYGKVKLNEPLAKHSTFKIGGPASYFVTITETEHLVEVLKFLNGDGTPYIILGGGSNTLFPDEGFDGVVIEIKTRHIEIDGNSVIADAGCVTVAVAQKSMAAGLTGFEWGVGVPGSIGGAVRGNAGAMGGDMKKDVQKVDVYQDGDVCTLTNAECAFGYRDSRFKHDGGVVLRVHLALEVAPPDSQLMKKAIEHLQYRNSTQPQGFASSGCMFKNVDFKMQNVELLKKSLTDIDDKIEAFEKVGKISAGWLIEEAGMKGHRVGNAEVSERHGNFVVNLGGATAADIRELVEDINGAVHEKLGIELEEEVAFV